MSEYNDKEVEHISNDILLKHYDPKKLCSDQTETSIAAIELCYWLQQTTGQVPQGGIQDQSMLIDDEEYDGEAAIECAIWAVAGFSLLWPQGIDYALGVFLDGTGALQEGFMAQGLPQGMPDMQSLSSSYSELRCVGPKAGVKRLCGLWSLPTIYPAGTNRLALQHALDPYRTPRAHAILFGWLRPHSQNDLDTSNDIITDSSPEEAFKRLSGARQARHRVLVYFALYARAASRGVLSHLDNEELIGKVGHPCFLAAVNISHNLVPFRRDGNAKRLWSKLGFMACCILLRGCAAALLEDLPSEGCLYDFLPAHLTVSPVIAGRKDLKLDEWREGFARFVPDHISEGEVKYNIDGDFFIKTHAAVCPRQTQFPSEGVTDCFASASIAELDGWSAERDERRAIRFTILGGLGGKQQMG